MNSAIEIYNPDLLGKPLGQYSHVTRVSGGDTLYIAGMLSVDKTGNIVGVGDFSAQTAQVFANIEAALHSAGCTLSNVVQFTTYLTSADLIPRFFEWRIASFPRLFPDGRYPPNTLLVIDRLVKSEFLIEVQTIAVTSAGKPAAAARRVPARKAVAAKKKTVTKRSTRDSRVMAAPAAMLDTRTAVRFAPRRLGHANLFVSDLDRSIAFYNRIVGLEEVRREPGIVAGFLSNGNTHHDIGLMQAMSATRVGRDGHVQVTEGRGDRAGLNHLGWEMESEAALVEAFRRARAAGLPIHRTTDHQLSHSIYVFDPDGNLHEFYADVVEDWRQIFNPSREDLVSGHWDPLAAPPMERKLYPVNPEVRRVEQAVFHPVRITHATIVARNIARMLAFFVDVAGLDPVEEAPGRQVLLRGRTSKLDLALLAPRNGEQPGLKEVSFALDRDNDFAAAKQRLRSAGVEVLDTGSARFVVRDPDGVAVEFYRGERPGAVLRPA